MQQLIISSTKRLAKRNSNFCISFNHFTCRKGSHSILKIQNNFKYGKHLNGLEKPPNSITEFNCKTFVWTSEMNMHPLMRVSTLNKHGGSYKHSRFGQLLGMCFNVFHEVNKKTAKCLSKVLSRYRIFLRS